MSTGISAHPSQTPSRSPNVGASKPIRTPSFTRPPPSSRSEDDGQAGATQGTGVRLPDRWDGEDVSPPRTIGRVDARESGPRRQPAGREVPRAVHPGAAKGALTRGTARNALPDHPRSMQPALPWRKRSPAGKTIGRSPIQRCSSEGSSTRQHGRSDQSVSSASFGCSASSKECGIRSCASGAGGLSRPGQCAGTDLGSSARSGRAVGSLRTRRTGGQRPTILPGRVSCASSIEIARDRSVTLCRSIEGRVPPCSAPAAQTPRGI